MFSTVRKAELQEGTSGVGDVAIAVNTFANVRKKTTERVRGCEMQRVTGICFGH